MIRTHYKHCIRLASDGGGGGGGGGGDGDGGCGGGGGSGCDSGSEGGDGVDFICVNKMLFAGYIKPAFCLKWLPSWLARLLFTSE